MSSLPVRAAPDVAPALSEIRPVPCLFTGLGYEFLVPATAHTLAGFRAWAKSDHFPERGRLSFIDGEICIDMSPEELETHSKAKAEVSRGLLNLNRKIKIGEFYPDGALVTNVKANLSTEPDGTLILWESLESKRVRLIPRKG